MPPNASQRLPTREQNLFRKIGRCYENKQYKKGLSFAKEILKSCPDHGETLAMRGLILASLGRKAEAQDSILAGLKKNIQSYVCWQVYGYFQRLQGNYSDAVKAYRNALRWDKDNLTILRDLSILEIHTRDFEGFKETRHKILMLKPGQRMSWIGYAVACHLVNDYDLAAMALCEYGKIEQSGVPACERSQLLLYENLVLREAGRLTDALDHIRKNKSNVTDKTASLQVEGEILTSLNKFDTACDVYYKLLERNTDNRQYVEKYISCAKQNGGDEISKLNQLCNNFPRSTLLKRIRLEKLHGEEYESLLREMMEYYLVKGGPALFKLVAPTDPEKQDIFEKVAFSLEERFSNAKNSPAVLWTWYLLAQYYCSRIDTDQALKYVDKVLRHTPTLAEAYLLRAEILKNCGAYNAASLWAYEAQSMDTADKYLNSECARYLLRDNLVEQAEEMTTKFTRGSVETLDYLNEMQCLWYLLDCAYAHFRLGQYGESLKKCHDIESHYLKFIESEYDFHSYCLRKMTLCSYIQTLRINDRVREHRYYRAAAQLAAKIYMRIYDERVLPRKSPSVQDSASRDFAKIGRPAKRGRNNSIARKEDATNERKRNTSDKNRSACDGDAMAPDSKSGCLLSPEELLERKDPLGEALKLLHPLILSPERNLATELLAFGIYLRQGKLFPAGRSLVRMKKMNLAALLLKCHAIRLQKALAASECKTANADLIRDVISEEFQITVTGPDSLQEIAADCMDKAQTIDEAFEVAKLLREFNDAEAAERLLSKIETMNLKPSDLDACERLFDDSIHDNLLDGEWIDRFRSFFATRFPRCDSFKFRERAPSESRRFENHAESLLITALLN